MGNYHLDCEKTMNAVTKLLNALAFANVNTLDELRTQLRQIDTTSASGSDRTQHAPASAVSDASAVAPGIRHAQGAL